MFFVFRARAALPLVTFRFLTAAARALVAGGEEYGCSCGRVGPPGARRLGGGSLGAPFLVTFLGARRRALGAFFDGALKSGVAFFEGALKNGLAFFEGALKNRTRFFWHAHKNRFWGGFLPLFSRGFRASKKRAVFGRQQLLLKAFKKTDSFF